MEYTNAERDYLTSQRLARIATASATGVPDVAPVGFRFDGEDFWVGGYDIIKTLKYKNVLATGRAALVVDDLESVNPWTPRGLKVRGPAEIVERDGGPVIRLHPERKWSWGVKSRGTA
jgi:pyridoxamine 5'-phosphate oxidase family protein